MIPPNLLSEKDVAYKLLVTANTLSKWRVYGRGPRFIRVNRRIAYDPADVTAWLDARRVNSTSEVV